MSLDYQKLQVKK